jgi:hypothetical protein
MLPKKLIVSELYTVAEGVRWRRSSCSGIREHPANVIHTYYAPHAASAPYTLVKEGTMMMFLGNVARVRVPNPTTGTLKPSGRKEKAPLKMWYLFFSMDLGISLWLEQHTVEKNIWPLVRWRPGLEITE